MTGMRTGNPKRPRKQQTCLSCGQLRYIKARQLCETCYVYAKKKGTIDQFPTQQAHRDSEEARRGFCGCFSPIVDPIPLFGARQCLKCGRPMRPS